MLRLRFWILSIVILISLSGCFVVDKPFLKIVNRYHLPVEEFEIYEASYKGASIYYNYICLNITTGQSETFELDYNYSLDAYIKVFFDNVYDVKIVRLNTGKITTVTLNENGILE